MMKRTPYLLGLLAVCALCLGTGCPCGRENGLTQFSTYGSVLAGIYDGEFTVGQLKEAGTLGLGTYNHLDGEMILLDGVAYQARSDRQLVEVADDAKFPFAAAVAFEADMTVTPPGGLDFAGLGAYLDASLPSPNLVYAARIEGAFPYLKIRTVPRQEPPYRPLSEVVQDQVVDELSDVSGTLIVLRMPGYLEEVGGHGYHMHFINAARTQAGHVLELTTGTDSAAVDVLYDYRLTLPESGAFLDTALDSGGKDLPAVF